MQAITRRAALPLVVLVLLTFLLYSSRQRLLPLHEATSPGNNRGAHLKILPLGDSITEGYGSSDKNGWRLHLASMLRSAGYGVEYIGSLSNGDDNPDNKHEGWGAHSISQIYQRVTGDDILKQKPNLVLLHAGTNDIDHAPPPEEPYETAPERLGKLIDLVLQECPDTVLLVATIIQDDHTGAQARADIFNKAVPRLVAERAAQGAKIALVDQKNIGGKDLVDLIHPTDHGYKLMAKNWAKAIQRTPEGWISSVGSV